MIKSLNYFWRLFATGLSFCIFGLAGVFLRAIIFPVLELFSTSPQQNKLWAQRWVHYGFYFFIGFMHRVGVMKYEINGLDKLNKSRQLIIANHPTLIDIVFLMSRMPVANCIVKEKLWHNPFMKGAVVNAGYISNADPEKTISESVKCLKSGGVMVIFPEGTRSVPGEKYKFQRSAAHIALQANAKVTPVTITCSPSTLTKQEKWYQIPKQRFHLVMSVGDDIVLDDFLAIEPKTIAVRRLNRYFQAYFENKRACNE